MPCLLCLWQHSVWDVLLTLVELALLLYVKAVSAYPLCAVTARALGENPLGSAPHPHALVVVAVPPADWKLYREFDQMTPEAQETLRSLKQPPTILALNPDLQYAREGYVFAARLDWTPSGLHTQAFMVAEANLPEAFVALLQEDWNTLSPWEIDAPERMMLVCTHGSHDSACGKLGYPIYQHLRQHAPAGTQIWRASHIGGHRFAPTLIDLPEGRVWGFLDQKTAMQVLEHSVHPAQLRGQLRGWMGLPPFAQILEGELFFQQGWDWIHQHRILELHAIEGEVTSKPFQQKNPARVVNIELSTQTGLYSGVVAYKGTGKTALNSGHVPLADIHQYRLESLHHKGF